MEVNPNTLSGSPDAYICMICSGNGLVCLRDQNSKLDALYICNPITREYIPLPLLPMHTKDKRRWVTVTYGIGISKLSGLYKVVRIFHKHIHVEESDSSRLDNVKIECMVYTLGMHLWRSIKPNEVYEYDRSVGVFLNGNFHWLVRDAERFHRISSFGLKTELFRPLQPPFPCSSLVMASLTVLGNCLCFCNFKNSDEEIDIWIMKEYGYPGILGERICGQPTC